MTVTAISFTIGRRCRNTWSGASGHSLWCLAGCAIVGPGMIAFCRATGIPWPTLAIMGLAVVSGLLAAIALETCILARQLDVRTAFRTAAGVSMISMEVDMNAVNVAVTSGAAPPWRVRVLPFMLLTGFLAPPSCNHWRQETYRKPCH